MKMTENELKELKAIEARDQAIHNLLDKIIISQEALNWEKNDFFTRLRKSHRIPDEESIQASSLTGMIKTYQPEKP